MVLAHEQDHAWQWAADVSIGAKIGGSTATLNEWIKKAGVDGGRRPFHILEMAKKMKSLEGEVLERW